MGTAEQTLLAHGFTGERLLKLCRKIANDKLTRLGGFMHEQRLEDLVGFLALQGVQAALRYDPERTHARYGSRGGDPFASWLADILDHRVTDWYRSKQEGDGDRRYHGDNRIVLDGEMGFAEPGDAFERELALRRGSSRGVSSRRSDRVASGAHSRRPGRPRALACGAADRRDKDGGMRAPAWARGQQPDVIETANEKMRADVAADRLHLRGVGHLPLNPNTAAWELKEGERALRSSRPRNRRWRALERLEQEIDRLTQRQADATARVQEAAEMLARGPDDDARTLAKWVAAGEKGERPPATIYERERERDAARLLLEAVTIELDEAIERRVAHIERYRPKMLADVRQDLDAARAALLAHRRELPALREALLDCREALLWVAGFPEAMDSFGFPSSVALGLRKPVERTLGTSARVEYGALVDALEEDVAALASGFSAEQKQRLGLDTTNPTEGSDVG